MFICLFCRADLPPAASAQPQVRIRWVVPSSGPAYRSCARQDGRWPGVTPARPTPAVRIRGPREQGRQRSGDEEEHSAEEHAGCRHFLRAHQCSWGNRLPWGEAFKDHRRPTCCFKYRFQGVRRDQGCDEGATRSNALDRLPPRCRSCCHLETVLKGPRLATGPSCKGNETCYSCARLRRFLHSAANAPWHEFMCTDARTGGLSDWK